MPGTLSTRPVFWPFRRYSPPSAIGRPPRSAARASAAVRSSLAPPAPSRLSQAPGSAGCRLGCSFAAPPSPVVRSAIRSLAPPRRAAPRSGPGGRAHDGLGGEGVRDHLQRFAEAHSAEVQFRAKASSSWRRGRSIAEERGAFVFKLVPVVGKHRSRPFGSEATMNKCTSSARRRVCLAVLLAAAGLHGCGDQDDPDASADEFRPAHVLASGQSQPKNVSSLASPDSLAWTPIQFLTA